MKVWRWISTIAGWRSRSAASTKRTIFKFSTLYELPFGKGKKWLDERLPEPRDRRMARQRDPDLFERYANRPDAQQLPRQRNCLTAQNRPVIDSYENWRAPVKGDKFDPGRR